MRRALKNDNGTRREAKGNKGSRQNSVVRLQESVALKMGMVKGKVSFHGGLCCF